MAVLVLMSQNLALSPVSATAQKREGQKYSLVHNPAFDQLWDHLYSSNIRQIWSLATFHDLEKN